MRDQKIIEMHQQAGKRDALILNQFRFLNARQQALEGVMLASTLRQRLLWLIWPEQLKAIVDATQVKLMEQDAAAMKEAMKAAAAKNSIVKPQIEVVSH